MILNKKQIIDRINKEPHMVSNIRDIKLQLQPAGLDLTVKKIFAFSSAGYIDFDNSRREISEKYEISPIDIRGKSKEYFLNPGVYQIELNELFNIPLDVIGFTTSRSSIQRCGAAVIRGFFDPGFIGKGVSLLEVDNPFGLYLSENARICQMEFHSIKKSESYNGIYKEME